MSLMEMEKSLSSEIQMYLLEMGFSEERISSLLPKLVKEEVTKESIVALDKEDLKALGFKIGEYPKIKRNISSISGASSSTDLRTISVGIDISESIIASLGEKVPSLISISELSHYLETCPSFQIPLSKDLYNITISKIGEGPWFMENNSRHANNFFMEYMANVIQEPKFGKTENSYHSCWDSTISRTCSCFNIYGIDRDTTFNSSSTGSKRPDFLCYYYGQALFRGEEKPDDPNLPNPKNELTDKLDWQWKGLEYILAYSAIGTVVEFLVLFKEKNKVHFKSLCKFNLLSTSNRLYTWNVVRNICRLLPTLYGTIQNPEETSTLSLSNDRRDVYEEGEYVIKKYSIKDTTSLKRKRIESIYKLMGDQVPYVDSLVKSSVERNRLRLKFQPKGYLSRPASEMELLKCLFCILKALDKLHSLGIIHRDLRWPNIVRKLDSPLEWFIIDFEEAFCPGIELPERELDKEEHAPEFSKMDAKLQDLWSIGRLISTSNISNVHSDLDQLKHRLLNPDPNLRLTLSQAIQVVEKLLQKYST